jgi:hypothetical protein
MDPETQALLRYLSTNFGLGAPVPNVNMELPFAEPPAPDFNTRFAEAGVPNPASMSVEVPYTPPPSLGQSLQPEGASRVPVGPVPVERPPQGAGLGDLLRSGVERVGQGAVDYMRSRAPAVVPPAGPFNITPKVIPGTDVAGSAGVVVLPAAPQQAAVFDQPNATAATPEAAKATAGTPASAGAGGQSGKLLEALRGVVTPKPPDVQRPIPHRLAEPHKIESTIAMLASLGITPKDLMHIPSLGASLRG